MTIYEANTIRWNKGDIIIHDWDAKEPKMLMRVIGYTREGLCKTKYVNEQRKRTIWENDIKNLHDPERFGMKPEWGWKGQEGIEACQSEWEMCRFWNQRREIGVRVETTSADGGFETTTKSDAYMGASGHAYVDLELGGAWGLKFLRVARPDYLKV